MINKRIFVLAAVFALLVFTEGRSEAQFTLFGNAGYYKPNGGEIGIAMNTSFGFQVGALYSFFKHKMSVGAEFGMQKYTSLNGYFGSGYYSEMHIKNGLLLFQYHFYSNKSVSFYGGIDAGLGHYEYLWTDTLKAGTNTKNGVTVAPNLGADMNLVKDKLALYAEIRYQITSTGELNYGDYFSSTHYDAIAVSLGLKFTFISGRKSKR